MSSQVADAGAPRTYALVGMAIIACHAHAQTDTAPVQAPAAPDSPARPPALPVVKVIGTRDLGLRADIAPITTKGVTPLIKTPMSVQVIPQALIDDRQANTLRDALETVSGVFAGSTSLHEDIIIRGFPVFDTYRNGARTRRIGVTELSNAARVDILKGPSSLQFGRGDVSGLLNVITRKPESTPSWTVQQQVGSRDIFQTQLDATGPIDAAATLLYRVNLSRESSNSFRDHAGTDRTFIAPSISWVPDAATRVDLELELSRDKSPIDRGIVAYGNRPAKVPDHLSYGNSFTNYRNDVALLALNAHHRLDNTWALRLDALAEQGRGQGLEYLQAKGDGTEVMRLARRIQQRDLDNQYVSFELVGTPSWGGFHHDLVAGADYAHRKGTFDFHYGDLESTPDLFAPAFGSAEPATPTQDLIHNGGKSAGIYVQDQVALTDSVNLMMGARYDKATEFVDNVGFPRAGSDDDKVSPRVGLLYTFAPGRAVFASYSESFSDANNSRTSQSLQPIEASQYEIGFKAESTDKRFFTTVALYDLTKRNVTAPDPLDSNLLIQVGEARSRGLEVDLGGRLASHVNLTGSYSYTDAKVTRDIGGNEGRRLYGVPKHAGKLFARYDVRDGGVQGLSMGAGVLALGKQEGDLSNSFQIPGYVRLDLMASYKWRTGDLAWTGQLNVLNVGDITYHKPSGARDEIAIGTPLTVLASIRAAY